MTLLADIRSTVWYSFRPTTVCLSPLSQPALPPSCGGPLPPSHGDPATRSPPSSPSPWLPHHEAPIQKQPRGAPSPLPALLTWTHVGASPPHRLGCSPIVIAAITPSSSPNPHPHSHPSPPPSRIRESQDRGGGSTPSLLFLIGHLCGELWGWTLLGSLLLESQETLSEQRLIPALVAIPTIGLAF